MLPEQIQHRQVGDRPAVGHAMPGEKPHGLARHALAELPDEP